MLEPFLSHVGGSGKICLATYLAASGDGILGHVGYRVYKVKGLGYRIYSA